MDSSTVQFDSSAILVTEDSCNCLIIQILIYENVWKTDKECADISKNKQRGLIDLTKLRQKEKSLGVLKVAKF